MSKEDEGISFRMSIIMAAVCAFSNESMFLSTYGSKAFDSLKNALLIFKEQDPKETEMILDFLDERYVGTNGGMTPKGIEGALRGAYLVCAEPERARLFQLEVIS